MKRHRKNPAFEFIVLNIFAFYYIFLSIFDYKNGGDRLIFKQIGDDKTFVHSTLNSVQIKKDKKIFKDGIWQRVSEDDLYIRFGEKGRIHRSRTKGVNGQFNENVEVANVASSKLYQGPYKVKS